MQAEDFSSTAAAMVNKHLGTEETDRNRGWRTRFRAALVDAMWQAYQQGQNDAYAHVNRTMHGALPQLSSAHGFTYQVPAPPAPSYVAGLPAPPDGHTVTQCKNSPTCCLSAGHRGLCWSEHEMDLLSAGRAVALVEKDLAVEIDSLGY